MSGRRVFPALLVALLVALLPAIAGAADPTVGWLGSGPAAFEGYTLFTPMNSTITYLIDDAGRVVHTWTSAHQPAASVYLLDSGLLLRTGRAQGTPPPFVSGGTGGRFQLLAWDSTVLWEFVYETPEHQQHHDVAPLPNGNVLVLAWERKTQGEAIAAGRNPAQLTQGELWPEHIVEVAQTGPTSGQIVWEWHLWDHLVQDFDAARANFGVVADHPELVDVNGGQGGGADWIHANSVAYNPVLDQIVISANRFDELWVIDHSTTSAEAAGHTGGNAGRGGDLLYRWGHPLRHDAGTPADRKLFAPHCIAWVPPGSSGAGNILIFNNGSGRGYSSVDEITPPLEPGGTYTWPAPGSPFAPAALTWTWQAPNPPDFFASFISGAYRLPNGNTVICDGPIGRFFEVDDAGAIHWDYIVPFAGLTPVVQGSPQPNTQTFRADRLAADHPGLIAQSLAPGLPIELYPDFGDFDVDGDVDPADLAELEVLFTGPGSGSGVAFANALGFFGDADLDGDLDCDDADAFQGAWSTPTPFPGVLACAATNEFRRGNANQDSGIDIGDPIAILGHLFAAGFLGCRSAAPSGCSLTRNSVTKSARKGSGPPFAR